MKNKGQNLVEFGIIFVLIIITCIIALTLLGNNVKNLFGKSNAKFQAYEPYAEVDNTPITYNKNFFTPDFTANKETDGSLNINVGGNNISVPTGLLQYDSLYNGNFDTIDSTGSSGGGLIREIAYMMEKYKDEYPDGDVPVQVIVGTSEREKKDYQFGGTVDTTTVSNSPSTIIKVGNHLVMLQSEESCLKNGNACKEGELKELGDFRIEGDIVTENGQEFFVGETIRTNPDLKKLETFQNNIAKYEGEGNTDKAEIEKVKMQEQILKDLSKSGEIKFAVDTTNGINFSMTGNNRDVKLRGLNTKDISNWNINFDTTDPQYDL